MWVALSGTPGTGKTAVASMLKTQGFMVVSLHRFAQENFCIVGVDRKRDSQLIDMGKLEKALQKRYDVEALVFFEGHIGHLLNSMEKVVVLRCHPQVLEQRLLKRKWGAQKRQENVEAEILDVILCEAVERHSLEDIFEIDTTKKTIEETAGIVSRLVKKKFQPMRTYRVGRIDWSEEILKRVSS
jgi:adenylate kinase